MGGWSEDWRVMLNSTQDQIKLKLKFELSLAKRTTTILNNNNNNNFLSFHFKLSDAAELCNDMRKVAPNINASQMPDKAWTATLPLVPRKKKLTHDSSHVTISLV